MDRPYGWSEVDTEVKSAWENHNGGTKFFDQIDAELTHPYFFDIAVRHIKRVAWGGGAALYKYLPPVAVSGMWGWAFSQWVKREGFLTADIIVFPGDLRHRDLVDNQLFEPLAPEYVFLDNSTYKGRTIGKIEEYLRKYRSSLGRRFVLYNGRLPGDRDLSMDWIYQWHENGFRESYR